MGGGCRRRAPGVESVDPVRTLDNGVTTVGFQTGDTGTGDGLTGPRRLPAVDRPPFEALRRGPGVRHPRLPRDGRRAGRVGDRPRRPRDARAALPHDGVGRHPGQGARHERRCRWGPRWGSPCGSSRTATSRTCCGFTSTGAIENTIPLLVLAFGFGLSMDYEVFLLSRIVELHEQGHDTRDGGHARGCSARAGSSPRPRCSWSSSSRVSPPATCSSSSRWASRSCSRSLIDATLVRMLLVPATMSVLGSVNWWAPAAAAPAPRALGDHRVSPVRTPGHAGRARRRDRGPPRRRPRRRCRVRRPGVCRGHRPRRRGRLPPPLRPRRRRGRRPSARHPAWRPCSTTRTCAPGSPVAATGTSACRAA